MDIADWRKQIDELDRQIVELINRRAQAAHEIGKLKINTSMPIYEPDRERAVLSNVVEANQGPLTDLDITQIFERIMDIMRNIQKLEMAPEAKSSASGETEFDLEVND